MLTESTWQELGELTTMNEFDTELVKMYEGIAYNRGYIAGLEKAVAEINSNIPRYSSVKGVALDIRNIVQEVIDKERKRLGWKSS